jgi:hypothetical protein
MPPKGTGKGKAKAKELQTEPVEITTHRYDNGAAQITLNYRE